MFLIRLQEAYVAHRMMEVLLSSFCLHTDLVPLVIENMSVSAGDHIGLQAGQKTHTQTHTRVHNQVSLPSNDSADAYLE